LAYNLSLICKLLVYYNDQNPKYIFTDHCQYYYGKLVNKCPIHRIANKPPLIKGDKKDLQVH
jgi:hypothetical protein